MGKTTCRELDPEEFFRTIPTLRSALGDRAVLRAHHFLQEDQRAYEMAMRLMEDDLDAYLKLVARSGSSSALFLQNLYAGSLPVEQGVTLALACTEHLLGSRALARVHGGGFAGTFRHTSPMRIWSCIPKVWSRYSVQGQSPRLRSGRDRQAGSSKRTGLPYQVDLSIDTLFVEEFTERPGYRQFAADDRFHDGLELGRMGGRDHDRTGI